MLRKYQETDSVYTRPLWCAPLLLVHVQRTSLGIMGWACGSLSPRERAGGEGP